MRHAAVLPAPCRPEHEVVAQCLDRLGPDLDWRLVVSVARPWLQAVRNQSKPIWVLERLLKEYPISSPEGLALMRLAEALLRVPDAETALTLTVDQLGSADFSDSSGVGMARVASAAMVLAQKMLPAVVSGGAVPGLLSRLGGAVVVAASLRAVQLLGQQFVLGQDMRQALQRADTLRHENAPHALVFSYDMLGEGARCSEDAERYFEHYQAALTELVQVGNPGLAPEHKDGLSIKLSALHPRFEESQRPRVLSELVPRVWLLCQQAAAANINLTIDAEEVERLELTLAVFEALVQKVGQYWPDWRGFGLALQAYQTRALDSVERVISLARVHRLRLMCRLVKGAYWDSEIKRAQELGLEHYPVFTHKSHTDLAYLACAKVLLAAPEAIFPQFATHNAVTIATLLQWAGANRTGFELQRLYGMGESVYCEVLGQSLDPQALKIPVRVYAPVGRQRDLLAYLVRRMLENGANNSFVHQLADVSVVLDELLASPLHIKNRASLPLPPDLWGPTRKNSRGMDLSQAASRKLLSRAFETNPLPLVSESDVAQVAVAFQACELSYRQWSQTEVSARSQILQQAADAMELEMARFTALLVKEGLKTWADAVSEVREAIDLLRYYATQAESLMASTTLPVQAVNSPSEFFWGLTGERNELRLKPRGVWVCISPWNFPLAIFVGQLAAALATGNTVLAKPAKQTPAVAWAAVRLLHQAGIPEPALQLLHGSGVVLGAALVELPAIAGVVFTGSTQVAKQIARTLAAKEGPIIPLIAETGGINAMLVDSSALPEQVIDAVLQSAFRSAGQRCSALRLLCLHEAVADRILGLLLGATAELVLGDPAQFETDVGPVIDEAAFVVLQDHIARLQQVAKQLLPRPGVWPEAAQPVATLLLPHIFEVPSIASVKQEIFGPVLQVFRWKGDPAEVIAQINGLGYGLTLGIQTRIDSRAENLASLAKVGNVYINRNMIGAVVGSQPFGGQGLSGTGPKAGGPNYLSRFCTEQTLCINTTAAGGNTSLLGRKLSDF